jgi:DNA helicase-2/ATP-dependent DNA helicase PcrA
MSIRLSPQQQDFINWVATGVGSCNLVAVAGAGKTTTILEAISHTQGGAAILAYNKKIAEEIKAKLAKRGVDWKVAEAGTVHSFGFRAFRKAFPKVKVEGYKVLNLIDKFVATNNFIAKTYGQTVAKLVGLAKQAAVGIDTHIDDKSKWFHLVDHFDLAFDFDQEDEANMPAIIDLAIEVLKLSNQDTTQVDFDDMVYLPVLHRVRFWQYGWVFVDEAQDTNAARRAIVRAMVRPGGRVVAVGDPAQAIYGFTGADADSLELIRRDFNGIEMPLTTTYRCPKAVVRFAQQWVSHIHAHESAPEGMVSAIKYGELHTRNDLKAGTAILCRNTKPLVALAFDLIRRKIACRIEGRDIAKGLVQLATKWKRVKTLAALENALDKWVEQQRIKALAKKQEQKAQEAEDRAETIKIVIDDCRAAGRDSVQAVVDGINSIFGDDIENVLVLSTIHKSKGREWETVYWLDRVGTLPSKYARQKWQQEQEMNLCYVAATRAMNSLIEVTVEE